MRSALDGIVLVEIDLHELALVGVHRGLEKLLWVHFAQAFEALDLHALFADLENLARGSPVSKTPHATPTSVPFPSVSSKIGWSLSEKCST